MFIKITSTKTGLEVGKVYDLCEMAAKNLIAAGQATATISKKELTVAKKDAIKRTADKKIALLAGNLAAAAEKATEAAKVAIAAVDAAKEAEAEAAEAIKVAEKATADAQTKTEAANNDETEGDDKPIDFSTYDPDELAVFAEAAGLAANITNPETIIKHLTDMGFVPEKETDETE